VLEKNLIVIPTYNEAGNIERLVDRTREIDPSDILIVDDNSPDGTGAIAENIALRDPSVSVLRRPKKLGLGSAHLQGMEWALKNGYDTVLTMDCDFTHPPEYIPQLRAALSERQADLVIGSRFPAAGWDRRLVVCAQGDDANSRLADDLDARVALRRDKCAQNLSDVRP